VQLIVKIMIDVDKVVLACQHSENPPCPESRLLQRSEDPMQVSWVAVRQFGVCCMETLGENPRTTSLALRQFGVSCMETLAEIPMTTSMARV
jgi:hypothetical protein